MPLTKGCSPESSKANYNRLLNEGYGKKQAFAIAINTARKYKHKCSYTRRRKIDEGKLFEE